MSGEARTVTAALVIIGNEILSGRTQDLNVAHIALTLNEIGIRLSEARVVRDEEAAIVEAINALRPRYAYVFTTGGIGPTHDDITARSIAAAFGVGFGRNAEAERRLRAYYPPERISEARLRMADIPEGAELIDNPVSVAPGFRLENVHVLPGVPKIMQGMLDNLKSRLVGGRRLHARTVVCYRPESEMAAILLAVERGHEGIEVGSYPFMRPERIGTSVVMRGPDLAILEAAAAQLIERARAIGTEIEDQGFT